jgi:hypothetical protein
MPKKVINERDTKLTQWLGEAYAKEAELEADLKAHIILTEKQSYASAQRPGRAPGGARRDRDLYPDRDARHRGR